jgi:putative oxidoreductase
MRPYGPLALRLAVGAVFVAHGLQKLLGIWGGPGISGTVHMVERLGFGYAYPLAILLILTEVAGGGLLVIGWATRWASLALAIGMALAIWKVHYPNGFFAMEHNIVLIGALVCLMLMGPGALSVDEHTSQSAEARARGRARMRKV